MSTTTTHYALAKPQVSDKVNAVTIPALAVNFDTIDIKLYELNTRTISITGDATGLSTVDDSGNISINLTVTNSGIPSDVIDGGAF